MGILGLAPRPGTRSESQESAFHVACKLSLEVLSFLFSWSTLTFYFDFFGALATGYLTRRRSNHALQLHHAFVPAVVKSRSPATEGDFNLHKSNSTYVTDLDVSRAYLAGLLFAPIFLQTGSSMPCNLIVSAISCTFHREIRPFQPYDIWTRVASWDDKRIYMVTHLVDNSKSWPRCYVMQAHASISSKMRDPVPHQKDRHESVFASAVTRMVFKKGRLTVPPKRALEICGLLSAPTAASGPGPRAGAMESATGLNEWTGEEVTLYRETNLPIVRLERGWDAVRELFREEQLVLAEYRDFVS